MPDYELEKRMAAAKSLELIESGMRVGLGTGSTSRYFLELLAARIQKGLCIEGVPTSDRTARTAQALGIPMCDINQIRRIHITVDGADEIDPHFNLIKGGGGALLWEKIVASISDSLVIVGDSRKSVDTLGRFPLPVEVIPFGWKIAADRIRDLGARVKIRLNDNGEPARTVEKNLILDCAFGPIPEPEQVAEQIRNIIGVVEHGLFLNLTDIVIIGRGEKAEFLTRE